MLGPALLNAVESEFPINDQPGHGTGGAHVGSAFDVGCYGSSRQADDLTGAVRGSAAQHSNAAKVRSR